MKKQKSKFKFTFYFSIGKAKYTLTYRGNTQNEAWQKAQAYYNFTPHTSFNPNYTPPPMVLINVYKYLNK